MQVTYPDISHGRTLTFDNLVGGALAKGELINGQDARSAARL